MGTQLLQFLCSAIAPSPPPPLLLTNCRNPFLPSGTRCCSTGYGGRSSRSHWDSNAEKTSRSERFRINSEDDFGTGDENDDVDRFGFGKSAKKRVWWSDYSNDMNDDDEGGFGVLEESIDMSWVFKVLNAFGWMLPAVGISMLLGSGPNTFIMALVLPLAQSAVSFAVDTFWGKSSGSPKRKRKTKKKPFSRAASDIGMREEREDIESGKNYQSWNATNEISTEQTRNKRAPSFGGWDELDKRVGSSYKAPKRAPTQSANEPQQQKRGKLSWRVKTRETPLFLRLLIAVFPFLGSWKKLM